MLRKNTGVSRKYLFSNNVLVGRNLKKMLTAYPIYERYMKKLTLDQIFILSYAGTSRFQEEMSDPKFKKDIEHLKNLDLLNASNRLTRTGIQLVGNGIFPLILRNGEQNKFNKDLIFKDTFIKHRYLGEVITYNGKNIIDFKDIEYNDNYGETKRILTPISINNFETGTFGGTIKNNFYNSVILTPINIEVGKSIVFHTAFLGDVGNPLNSSIKYRISVKEYCYFINEYGPENLRFLAKRHDYRPTALLVAKNEQRVGMILLPDGSYYNDFNYNDIYENYDEYISVLGSLQI